LAFLFLLIYYRVGRTPWIRDQPIARPLLLPRRTQTQNKRTQTAMPPVEPEPTIAVLQRAKTVNIAYMYIPMLIFNKLIIVMIMKVLPL
jgi:hypothetical protein